MQASQFLPMLRFQTFIEFYIFNNGQPIDIVLGHGDKQDPNDTETKGAASFIIFDASNPDRKTYPNPVS
jgi:hypothetical protein